MNIKFTDFHFIVLLFLFFSLVTSNHFLIFNEETVVAICFVSFIAFSFQFFGKSVAESMDERSVAIKSEFHQALLLEKQYCNQVMYEHEQPIKKTGAFILMAKTLLNAKLLWYRHFRQQYLSTFFEQTLRSLVDSKLQFRVQQINLSKKVFQEKWVNLMASEFKTSLLSDLNKARNNQAFQDVLITQSISAIKAYPTQSRKKSHSSTASKKSSSTGKKAK